MNVLVRLGSAVAAVAGLTAVAVLSGCAAAGTRAAGCTAESRGTLVDTTKLAELSREQVAAELARVRLPVDGAAGVLPHRIRYCTIDPSGSPTTASGLLAYPTGAPPELPLVVYAHGTVVGRAEVPSRLGGTEGRVVPLFFASNGFTVIAPDYLGLGDSPGPHPYLHAATEASATLDLLTAADTVGDRIGARLSRTVLVSGHSQGGQATMAIGRVLGQGAGPWKLGALAPMAGQYDLAGTGMPAVLDPAQTDQRRASAYLAYLFTSWKALYQLYSDPREVFTDRYAGVVENLFDGTHGFPEIQAALPLPAELFRPETLALIANPTGRFADGLRDCGVCDFAPAAPTRLYVGQRDTDVVPANAASCRIRITAAGGTADVVDVGPVDHIGTAVAALPLIREWFSGLSPR